MSSITPDTKLSALLENFPQLEERLLQISPAFAKLNNPLLRRTIAKVATLRQVAQVGGIPLADLINNLREAAGMSRTEVAEAGTAARPQWLDNGVVVKSFDARELLASGGHPLNQVLSEITGLQKNQIYELITPFVPAPLIDVVEKKGFKVWSEQKEPGLVHTYIFQI